MKNLNKIKLTPEVKFDEKSKKFEIKLNEVGILGTGSSKQEAVNKLLEAAKSSSIEFFYNLDFYSGVPELMEKYPYYFSFGKCKTQNDFLKLINLEPFNS